MPARFRAVTMDRGGHWVAEVEGDGPAPSPTDEIRLDDEERTIDTIGLAVVCFLVGLVVTMAGLALAVA